MIDLSKIDRKVQGWGVELDGVEIEKFLEHLLWECICSEEFRQKCEFVFNGPKILLIWREYERSVTIQFEDGRKITASV